MQFNSLTLHHTASQAMSSKQYSMENTTLPLPSKSLEMSPLQKPATIRVTQEKSIDQTVEIVEAMPLQEQNVKVAESSSVLANPHGLVSELNTNLTHRRTTLLTLPTELHLLIFSHLDPIDSTCFGLSHPGFYALHRFNHPSPMPLNTRRAGKNLLESAWEVVGLDQKHHRSCRHCGVVRCELHMHVASWMPEDQEYCAIREKFGRMGDGAKGSCHRNCPPKPNVCGWHVVKKGKDEVVGPK